MGKCFHVTTRGGPKLFRTFQSNLLATSNLATFSSSETARSLSFLSLWVSELVGNAASWSVSFHFVLN